MRSNTAINRKLFVVDVYADLFRLGVLEITCGLEVLCCVVFIWVLKANSTGLGREILGFHYLGWVNENNCNYNSIVINYSLVV